MTDPQQKLLLLFVRAQSGRGFKALILDYFVLFLKTDFHLLICSHFLPLAASPQLQWGLIYQKVHSFLEVACDNTQDAKICSYFLR